MLHEVAIDEVSVDALGRLTVRPRLSVKEDFAFIYRAGMEIGWDPESRTLFAPPRNEWSHADWFDQIRKAASGEYDRSLVLVPETRWSNVPEDSRADIEHRAACAKP